MKKFRLFTMASLLAFAAGAQAQIKCVTAEPVVFEAGETTAELVINMDYETDKAICSWGFNLYLPDGIDIENEEVDGTFYYTGEYGFETNPRAIAGTAKKPNDPKVTKKQDGGYLILGYSDSNAAMLSTHGKLVSFTLTGSDAISGIGKISSTSCSYMDGSDAVSADQGLLADSEFAVNGGGESQGINDIKADATAGKVFNIGGQQVAAPTKGLYIQNGKKVIVK